MYNMNNSPQPVLFDPDSTKDESFIPKGRAVPFINGPKWVDQSIKLVFQQPKTWAAILAVFIVLELAFTIVSEQLLSMNASPSYTFLPLIGNIIETLLFAGIIAVAESQRLTGRAEFGLINTGFVTRTGGIIASMLVQVLIMVAGIVCAGLFIGVYAIPYMGQIAYAAEIGDQDLMTQAFLAIGVGRIIFAVLIVILALIISQMLTCFAIPLMINKQFSLMQALSASFSGALKNILPAFAYFISLAFVFIIIGALTTYVPFFNHLFWLFSAIIKVVFWYLVIYAAYRNIFNYSESITN